jgi:hypothetical protein
MKKLLIILVLFASCKKEDVKPTETKTVKTTTVTPQPIQYYTITVEGITTQIKVNGFEVNTNYFQCKTGDQLYVLSQTICSTLLNSNGTVKGYECNPNNKLIIKKDNVVITNKTCSCDLLEQSITF